MEIADFILGFIALLTIFTLGVSITNHIIKKNIDKQFKKQLEQNPDWRELYLDYLNLKNFQEKGDYTKKILSCENSIDMLLKQIKYSTSDNARKNIEKIAKLKEERAQYINNRNDAWNEIKNLKKEMDKITKEKKLKFFWNKTENEERD